MMSKRQTHREVGAQSHGSAKLMRTDWQTARPPKFLVRRFYFCKGGVSEENVSDSPWYVKV
jgi:hypothetical protein